MSNIEDLLDTIIEDMIGLMGDGGMDTSYSGEYFDRAKKEAIEKIVVQLKLSRVNTVDEIYNKGIDPEEKGLYFPYRSLAYLETLHHELHKEDKVI